MVIVTGKQIAEIKVNMQKEIFENKDNLDAETVKREFGLIEKFFNKMMDVCTEIPNG